MLRYFRSRGWLTLVQFLTDTWGKHFITSAKANVITCCMSLLPWININCFTFVVLFFLKKISQTFLTSLLITSPGEQDSPPVWPQETYRPQRIQSGVYGTPTLGGIPNLVVPSILPDRILDRNLDRINDRIMGYPLLIDRLEFSLMEFYRIYKSYRIWGVLFLINKVEMKKAKSYTTLYKFYRL